MDREGLVVEKDINGICVIVVICDMKCDIIEVWGFKMVIILFFNKFDVVFYDIIKNIVIVLN